MKRHELVCISCPVGCALTVHIDGSDVKVLGNQCRLGAIYGAKEVTDPRRIITTSIFVHNEDHSVSQILCVKTDGDVPKPQMAACVTAIKEIELKGNIQVGDIVVKNILNLGVDVVATRDICFKS